MRFLALGVAGTGAGSGPLIGLTFIAYGLARDGVQRLTLGLGGWTRSLPLNGVQHRRGVMYGLPIIQLPLMVSVIIAALLVVFGYHRPLAFAKLLGAPLALVAAGAAVIPSRRWFVATPLFAASALLASFGSWLLLGVALALFVVADLTAGAIRFPSVQPSVPSPAAPGTLQMFRFTWRALGLRLLLPLPVAVLALAAAWFYSRNNELSPADTGFVARLWAAIAIALYVGGVGDIIAARRPAWPWLRSLPWSSHDRAVDDCIAIALPALGVAVASIVVDVRTVIFSLAVLIPLSALAAALLRGARRRLTRVSGPLVVVGILLGTAGAFAPWIAAVALLTTPWLLRLAAWRDRREMVTGWKELYHDAAGDSLAWSAR